MSEDTQVVRAIFSDYLEGLINLDEEMKKPENIDPYFRKMEGAGGIHFWQLQEFIEELAHVLIQFESEFEELEKEWKVHDQLWGRYLGTAAIQYARNLIEDPEYDDCEFSMDWFGRFNDEGE